MNQYKLSRHRGTLKFWNQRLVWYLYWLAWRYNSKLKYYHSYEVNKFKICFNLSSDQKHQSLKKVIVFVAKVVHDGASSLAYHGCISVMSSFYQPKRAWTLNYKLTNKNFKVYKRISLAGPKKHVVHGPPPGSLDHSWNLLFKMQPKIFTTPPVNTKYSPSDVKRKQFLWKQDKSKEAPRKEAEYNSQLLHVLPFSISYFW